MSLIINKSLTLPIVSRETKILLKTYYRELMLWNKSIALTEELDEDDYFLRHIHDALQLNNILPTGLFVLDLGSGCGIPGIPLAILGKRVTMIESVRKKTVFLNHVIKKLSLTNASVLNSRVENLYFDQPVCVTARALCELKGLLKYMLIVSRETMGVFLKGRTVFDEIDIAEAFYVFDYELYESVGDGYVILIKNVKER
jgi:16S rRNA (guanine527-N7)-methyltransferase